MLLASFRHVIRSGRLAWLLALVLWLPAAQWAAASHALLHLQSSTAASAANDGERPGHLGAPCDTCLVAAALGCGAPPANAPTVLPPAPPAALPQAPSELSVALPPPAHYRSRAPPPAHA